MLSTEPAMTPVHPQPDFDLDAARRFLTALDEEAESFTFQTFADHEDADEETKRQLARVFHGPLEATAAALGRLNARLAGVYVMVNAGDLEGRTSGNVVGVRALFTDFDGTPLPAQWPLEPHLIIESSPGKWHVYWLASGVELDEFSHFQKTLAARFGSDPKVNDLPRVMRLPGFLHQKGAPFVSRIVHEMPAQPYSREELVRAFNLDAPTPAVRVNGQDQAAILKGQRDDTLYRLGCSLRARGLTQPAIEAVLREENRQRCSPPLPEDQIRKLAEQAGKYAPGTVVAGAAAAPLPGYTVAAIWQDYVPPRYLIKRILAPGELTVLFGQSGHFKSVIALDAALSTATGTEFQGFKTRKAGVLYVAGEGHGGIKKRIRAWMLSRGLDATSEPPALFVTSAGTDLIGNPEQLVATVEHAAKILGVPIELVVIDTLAANFGPGDEYHPRDMTLAIAGAREAAPAAAVLLVHHTGHGNQDRERGSYSLIAAADYRLQAEYDEPSKLLYLKWHKSKDDEKPEPAVFQWRAIPLQWHDEDDEELTSVIVERIEGEAPPQGPRSVGLGKNQETAMRSLRALYAKLRKNLEANGRDPAEASVLMDGWRADCERRGLRRQRWHEVQSDLQERRLILLEGPHVRLIEGAR
jgi:hypothetical protein